MLITTCLQEGCELWSMRSLYLYAYPSVCLSGHISVSKRHKIFCTCYLCPWQCNTLYTCSFVNDVVFSHNGPDTDTGCWQIIRRDSTRGHRGKVCCSRIALYSIELLFFIYLHFLLCDLNNFGTADSSFTYLALWSIFQQFFYATDSGFFSERELTFTFAICCRPSVCRLSVVCRL